MIYDTIIVGKGPAGISAAIYLARGKHSVLVIGKGFGALKNADKIDNYYGFENPINAHTLHENGISQAKRLGASVLNDEVISITQDFEDFSFTVKTPKDSYRAKTVLLATGKTRTTLKIPGFSNFLGNGISFCAVCDGFFYKEKSLAVIGSGDYAANEIEELLRFTKNITLFTNGEDLKTDKLPKDINIVNDKIIEISGDNKVEKILTEAKTYNIDGIFVAVGIAGASDFALKLGIITKDNNIIVDNEFSTNVKGVFAAGDCIGGLLQIAKAVSDGANASVSIKNYLKNL